MRMLLKKIMWRWYRVCGIVFNVFYSRGVYSSGVLGWMNKLVCRIKSF